MHDTSLVTDDCGMTSETVDVEWQVPALSNKQKKLVRGRKGIYLVRI